MKGKDWGRLGIFTLGLGAMIWADEPIQKYALTYGNIIKDCRRASS